MKAACATDGMMLVLWSCPQVVWCEIAAAPGGKMFEMMVVV